ncbi:MAG: S9 family peptidase [Idiomarina sp.]
MKRLLASTALLVLSTTTIAAEPHNEFTLTDVFELEYASQPSIHPSGDTTIFVRNFMDKMSDRKLGNLWSVDDKGNVRPVTVGNHSDHSPVWSPDGSKLAFVSSRSGSPQIHMLWQDTQKHAPITRLNGGPSNLSWSPNGEWLAFTMFTKQPESAPVSLPGKPEGADWADPAIYIDKDNYRFDGGGYAREGYQQIYIMPASGGTPRQLTHDDYNHGGTLSWSGNGEHIYFSGNLREDAFEQPTNSELYSVNVRDGEVKQITDRVGPDSNPVVSPDGKKIAWLGFDDKYMSYQTTRLYVMDADGDNARVLTEDLDSSVNDIQWSADSSGLYLSYDSEGEGYIAYQSLRGKRTQVVDNLGGLSYSRPYSGGAFSVANDSTIAYTMANTQRPAELAIHKGKKATQVTNLNDDLFAHKTLGKVEEIWYESSHDGKKIQGWIVYPPNYDASKKYPLILEIHGGPHTAYAPSFAAEVQLFAQAGYVVLYTNPRGSTSYGADFAQEIHHNYPSEDYNDLMDGVDAVIEKGIIDEDQLYVTGGSGGGVLSAWIVGHTDRFRAAVVAKPVINWYSFVLTADAYNFFYKYWFPGLPWDNLEHYMKYSPISYVGNVTTPTMLLTGEDDYRTPISESEQYYQALKLEGVETAMVRIPGSGHGIYSRPSNLMAKVAYILHWFEKHKETSSDE